MIVPSNKLLGLVALVVTPGLTLVSLGGGLSKLGLAFVATALGLALLDAAISYDRLRGLRVDADSPVHAIVDRPLELRLRVFLPEHGRSWLTLEFDVPKELEPVTSLQRLSLATETRSRTDRAKARRTEVRDDGQLSSVSVTGQSRVLHRGRFRLTRLHAETDSSLGFWWVRRDLSVDLRIHGYPDLKADRRLLVAQNYAKQSGVAASLLTGRGRAFDRLRDYVPGDELDDIHWRATAKRHKPTTKLYQLERDQRIYAAIDQSRLSARPSPREWPTEDHPLSLLDRYINTALVLGSVAQAQGDQFGLLGFSDRVTSFSPAGSGPAHYKACREAILEFGSRPVNADYRELFGFFATKVRRRSMLFLLTSVDDPALREELVASAKIIADRHLVVAAAVAPTQACSLADAEPIECSGQIVERLAAHMIWRQLRQTARQLGQNGVRFLSLGHQSMVPRVVGSYTRIKRGQLL